MPLRKAKHALAAKAAAAGTAAMSTGTRAHGGRRYPSRVTSRFGVLLHVRAGHSEGKANERRRAINCASRTVPGSLPLFRDSPITGLFP